MTLNLLNRAQLRARDQDFFRTLAQLLASRHQDDGLREELWNYTDLYDVIIGRRDPNQAPEYINPNQPPPPLKRSSFSDADLTDWIFTVQSHEAADADHAIRKWRQTGSRAWLMAALIRADGPRARRFGLIDASRSFEPGSPGYLLAAYHRNRLRIETSGKDAAREELNAILASDNLHDLPSSVNLFRSLRMLAAPAFHDFTTFALRKPVLFTSTDDEGQFPENSPDSPEEKAWFDRTLGKFAQGEKRLDCDSTYILNYQTPFRLLEEAALDPGAPPSLHRELLLTAFTRGLMLNKDLAAIAKALAGDDSAFEPLARPYLDAVSDEEKRFAAAFLILRHPEARPYLASGIPRQTPPGKIDNYRDNWWCPMDLPVELDSFANMGGLCVIRAASSRRAPVAEFLSSEEAVQARLEVTALGRAGNATDFLGRIVLDYAAGRRDSRIPEALHLLVQAGHFGCQDTNTWKTSRAAFRELHERYPGSAWAAKTKSWFRDQSIRGRIEPQHPTP
jgi:hypothetical protein